MVFIMGVNRNFILTLGVGVFCGFFSFYLLNSRVIIPLPSHDGGGGNSIFLSPDGHAHSHKELQDARGPAYDVAMHEHLDERVEADRLAEEVRVLCWVMTNPKNHVSKARHVKATWARRCNKVVFMSTKEDKELGAVALDVSEGRDHLWQKTKAAFKYIYENHFNDAEWFMKADDDTYVIVENLRYLLKPFNSRDPIWFGCRFKKFVKEGYMSGGAGYVLSKEAVRKFVEEAMPNNRKCRSDSAGAEDVEMGKCLQNVGVIAKDTRDSHGRGRFFPFIPEHHLIPGHIGPSNWYWEWIYYPSQSGIECCSDTAVSFHYVSPNKMYELEYLLYHLRPYGILPSSRPPPPPVIHATVPHVQRTEASTSSTQSSARNETIVSNTENTPNITVAG